MSRLQIKKKDIIDNFVDAKNEGSSIDVTGAFTYYSWNDNKQIVENTTGLPKALYEFYQVREAVWPLKAGSDNILDVTKIKTNLKLTDGNLEPEEGYTMVSCLQTLKSDMKKKISMVTVTKKKS